MREDSYVSSLSICVSLPHLSLLHISLITFFIEYFSIMRKTFSIHSTNIRGLRSNVSSVEAYLIQFKPTILALCETQIQEPADTHSYQFKGYSRIDKFVPHRGLAIYIREDVIFSIPNYCTPISNPEFNTQWVELRVAQHTLFFCFVYRSPNTSNDDTSSVFEMLSDYIDVILDKSPNAEIVVAGDFNVYNDTWLPNSKPRNHAGEVAEIFAALNLLTQTVNGPTRIPDRPGDSPHCLDLFLTTHPTKYKMDIRSPIGSSDHCVVCAEFKISSPAVQQPIPSRTLWHYNRANWAGLNEFFQNFEWASCFLNKNVDIVALLISTVILTAMKEFIPSSLAKPQNNKSNWFNNACKIAIAAKQKSYSTYKLDPTPVNKAQFILSRNYAKEVIRNSKIQFDLKLKEDIRKILENNTNNKRTFWSFAGLVKNNFLSSQKSSIPPLIEEDTIYSTALEQAECLSKRFASNSHLPDSNQPIPEIPQVASTMRQIYFRPRVVSKVLKEMNVNKSAGPDGIPPIVLKKCHSSLAKPLSRLFHLSMSSGVFPSIWKTANVHPIPKKGAKSDPANYRPIALVSVLSKVVETIINFNLTNYLEENKLISDRQYGFRKRRSCGDLLVYVTELWNRCVHKQGEAQLVALDISKAFDRVWHAALLAKLKAFGLHSSLIQWIENFLSDRKIQVVVDGQTSQSYSINAGVPQGSVLSPTLFLIFINDLLSSTLNPIHSFADDSSLSSQYSFDKPTACSSSAVANKRLQMGSSLSQDLITINKWGIANRVEFNENKFQACLISNKSHHPPSIISINSDPIANAPSVRMLGMDVSSKLSWKDQIYAAAKGSAKCLGYLRRCKFFFNSHELLTIYKAYVRPRMEYNSHIWAGAPKTHLVVLDRIQNRIRRMIADPLVADSLASLDHRRNVGALCIFYKYYYGQSSDELKQLMPPLKQFPRSTRHAHVSHAHTLETIYGRTNKFRSTFLSRTTRLWNRLDSSAFPPTFNIKQFKKNVNGQSLKD